MRKGKQRKQRNEEGERRERDSYVESGVGSFSKMSLDILHFLKMSFEIFIVDKM